MYTRSALLNTNREILHTITLFIAYSYHTTTHPAKCGTNLATVPPSMQVNTHIFSCMVLPLHDTLAYRLRELWRTYSTPSHSVFGMSFCTGITGMSVAIKRPSCLSSTCPWVDYTLGQHIPYILSPWFNRNSTLAPFGCNTPPFKSVSLE